MNVFNPIRLPYGWIPVVQRTICCGEMIRRYVVGAEEGDRLVIIWNGPGKC